MSDIPIAIVEEDSALSPILIKKQEFDDSHIFFILIIIIIMLTSVIVMLVRYINNKPSYIPTTRIEHKYQQPVPKKIINKSLNEAALDLNDDRSFREALKDL